jgi:hypothetical protein
MQYLPYGKAIFFRGVHLYSIVLLWLLLGFKTGSGQHPAHTSDTTKLYI